MIILFFRFKLSSRATGSMASKTTKLKRSQPEKLEQQYEALVFKLSVKCIKYTLQYKLNTI